MRKYLLLGGIVLCLGIGVCAVIGGSERGESEIVTQIEDYKGYTRVVSKEEQDFYSYFVKRNLGTSVDEEEMKVLLEEYINEANAVFYLGNQLGLYEPYSFELLKLRMEQENRDRKLKLEQGEVIYGIEQFTLETYYQYERENLESDIVAYLEENIDHGLMKKIKRYYEENKEIFKDRECVVYEVTQSGVTKNEKADSSQLEFLGNADPLLADFLETAECEDVYTDGEGETKRTIVIKDIIYTPEGFEKNKDRVLSYYVRTILKEELIDLVAKNNPVELE